MKTQKKWNAALLVDVILPLLIFVFCLSVSVGLYWVNGEHNLDSDISSEFVLADLLNQEGKLITDNWFYSTELRVVSPVPVYQLTLALFHSDWHLARTVSIAILLCVVAASLVYMTRGVRASLWASLLCAAAIVLPVTDHNAFTLVYGGFYTICVALTFTQIGLVLRMDKRRLLEPILLLALGFLGGLNGVRQLMVCVAPLLAACAVTFYLEARRCERLSEAAKCPSFWLLLGGVILAVATFAGNWVNANVLAQKYYFELHDETMIVPMMAEMFTDQIMSLMGFFGYRGDVMLVSREGVMTVLCVILPFLGAGCMALLLTMKLDARERLLAVFMPIALLLGITVNVLTLGEAGADPFPKSVSYYMPAVLLLVFAIFWALDRFKCGLKLLRVVPMLALVGVFLTGTAVYKDEDMISWEGELEEIANLLVEEGCTAGYATFWNANVLGELSDGKLDVYAVENDMTELTVGEWLQRCDHADSVPDGKFFILYGSHEWEMGAPGLNVNHLVYSSDQRFVVVYDSWEEFKEICEEYEAY